jgi:hypothetical protein
VLSPVKSLILAHNRALDLLRSRTIRAGEPIGAAHEVADPESVDPVELMMRREAVETAVSRFAELPTMQRSLVILKDVLDQSLEEIATMLDLTVNAVKAHLARGRARLKAINAQALAAPVPRSPSPDLARGGREWRSRRRGGRPTFPTEIGKLIREMSIDKTDFVTLAVGQALAASSAVKGRLNPRGLKEKCAPILGPIRARQIRRCDPKQHKSGISIIGIGRDVTRDCWRGWLSFMLAPPGVALQYPFYDFAHGHRLAF